MSKPKRTRLTDTDYAELAADYATNPLNAADITTAEVNPAFLRTGRPTKGAAKSGRTPTRALRMPDTMRAELRNRVDNGEAGSESELIRRAIAEYFDRHPSRENGDGPVASGQVNDVHR